MVSLKLLFCMNNSQDMKTDTQQSSCKFWDRIFEDTKVLALTVGDDFDRFIY